MSTTELVNASGNATLWGDAENHYRAVIQLHSLELHSNSKKYIRIQNLGETYEKLFKAGEWAGPLTSICNTIVNGIRSRMKEAGYTDEESQKCRKYVAECCPSKWKRKYDPSIVGNRTIDPVADGQSISLYQNMKSEIKHLEKQDLSQLNPLHIQELTEMMLDAKDRMVRHCESNQIAICELNSPYSSVDMENSGHTSSTITYFNFGEIEETLTEKALARWIGAWQNIQKIVRKKFSPQMVKSDREIAQAFNDMTDFLLCGMDAKYKRDVPQWFEIVDELITNGLSYAIKISKVSGMRCKHCSELMSPTNVKLDKWSYQWHCKKCDKTDPETRYMSKEQIKQKQHEILNYNIKLLKSMPFFMAFLKLYRGWILPSMTQHTIDLEEKFSDSKFK